MRTRIARTLPPSLLLLVAAIFLFASSHALADGSLPDVVGRSESEAVDQLEALGLQVHVVTVAGVSPGRVATQSPAAGAAYVDGDEVELRVGVRVNITTRAPRVIGMRARRAIAALEAAYLLEVLRVAGPRGMEGRVLSQEPAPDAEILFRGPFRIRVVRNNMSVPLVVGRTEDAARQLLADARLRAAVRYRRTQFAPRGTVLSQEPVAGASTAPGSVIELVIAGRGDVPPGGSRVTVPDVVGFTMHDAEAEILAAGLVPHVHLREGGDATPAWSVLSQEVAAGRRVREGHHVGIDVAKPAHATGGVHMPSLYGQSKEEMLDLLTHMGITIQVRERPSSRPAGTVIGQSPRPGVIMADGTRAQATVAVAPPRGWRPPVLTVPNVDGLRPVDANLRLRAAGFLPRLRRDTGAGEPIDRVFRQDPRAGVRKPAGTRVLYYVPYRATVPNVIGMTRTQAIDALQDATLQGLGERVGSVVLGGISRVISQQHAAGATIARNSLVRFRYRMVAAPTPVRAVPNVIGLTKEVASARITAAGFNAVLRALSIGVGSTRVVSQSPVGGSLRPAGHTVQARYRFVGAIPGPFVRVQRVIGMSRADGKRRLETLGFVVRSVRAGPLGPGAHRTEIIAQSPLGGTLKARGSTITITYRIRPVIGVRVRVPNVVGKRLDRATDALRRAGLSWSTTSLGTRVRSQSPAAGTLVLPGSSVRLRLKF